MIDLLTVAVEIPPEANIIIGQSHFVKTVEDIYEAVATTAPQAKFGLAFNESSGPCLIRSDGNDPGLRQAAIRNAQKLAAGHVFAFFFRTPIPSICSPLFAMSLRSVPSSAPPLTRSRWCWRAASTVREYLA